MEALALRPWDKPRAPVAAVAQSNIARAIDELGQIRDQIKDLEAKEKSLVSIVKEQGEGEHKGAKCKAVVSITQTSRLDTTALKEALPEEMVTKFTKTSDVVKVTIKPLF